MSCKKTKLSQLTELSSSFKLFTMCSAVVQVTRMEAEVLEV